MTNNSAPIVEDHVGVLVGQARDLERCERRWAQRSPLLEGRIRRLKLELLIAGDDEDRDRINDRLNKANCEFEARESAYLDHEFPDTVLGYAQATGVDSTFITEAARARFDAARLPAGRNKGDLCHLLDRLYGVVAEPAAPTDQVETEPNEPEPPKEPVCGAQETSIKDISDETGFVEFPVDPTAYILQSQILAKHTPAELTFTDKEFRKVVEKRSNCVRWTRPRNQEGKLRLNRRLVHLGDWHQYVNSQTATESDGTPHVPPEELAERTAGIRAGKSKGGSSDPTSQLLTDLSAGREK